MQNPAEPRRTTQNHAEPRRTTQNPAEPHRTTQNPAEPRRTTQNPAEPRRTLQNHANTTQLCCFDLSGKIKLKQGLTVIKSSANYNLTIPQTATVLSR